jgi:hypothetical protein
MPAIGISMPVVCDQLRLNGYPIPALSPKSMWLGLSPMGSLLVRSFGPKDSTSTMWRSRSMFGLSVVASFVWWCPNNFALTPFPHPAHRTRHADLSHPTLGQDITPSYTAGSQPWTSQTHGAEVPTDVLGWISPAPATSNLLLVA